MIFAELISICLSHILFYVRASYVILAELISICLSRILFYARVYLNMRARLYARARTRTRVRICMIEEVSAARRPQASAFNFQTPGFRF